MMKYIDANKIRAEIKRMLILLGQGYDEIDRGQIAAYEHLLSFLDTLQEPASAEGMVQTDCTPMNLIVSTEQWNALLGQFDNGQRVRIILVKED